MADDTLPPPPTGAGLAPEIDHKDAAKLAAEGTKDSGVIERAASATLLAIVKLILPALRVVASNADEILAALALIFQAAQAEGTKGFSDLVAALLGDLLGIEVSGEEIFQAFQKGGRLPGVEKVGGALVDLLTDEFTRGGELSPEQGREAMRTFLGFVMSFSVREGNTDVLVSLIPEELRVGEGFKSYAEAMARNLGLGRLSRLALRPFVQTLMVTPNEWSLNKQYHPTLLTESQAIRAFFAKLIDESTMFEEIERKGFSRERIRALVELQKESVGLDDLELLTRYGVMSRADAVGRLVLKGFTPDEAELALTVVDLRRVDGLVRSQAAVYQQQALDGTIDPGQLELLLEPLPLTDTEKLVLRRTTGARLELPRRFLTLAQMTDALVDGVVDLDEYDEFLVREGYSADDQQILRIRALLRIADEKRAAEEKKKRAERKQKPPAQGP